MIHSEAVRKCEYPLAKARQQFAGRIKLQNRWLAIPTDARGGAGGHGVETSMKHPDVALRIQIHPDELAPFAFIHAHRERRPALDEAVRIGERVRIGLGAS